MSLIRAAYALASSAGLYAKLSIFIFHRVLPELDPLLPWEPTRQQFDSIIRFISNTFNVLSLADAAQKLAAGTLPSSAAVITFDDGYADNFTEAREILHKHGTPATFFIATSFLDGGRMWNDDVIEAVRIAPDGVFDLKRFGLGTYALSDIDSRVQCYEQILGKLKYLPHRHRQDSARQLATDCGLSESSNLMMTTDQLIKLHKSGMEIGAHTDTHPILSSLPNHEAENEILKGKSRLETILQHKIEVFAYPNGAPGRDYGTQHVAMVKEAGFVAAVSTEIGVARMATDPWQLPRFTPWDKKITRFALRSLHHLYRS